MPQVNDGEGLGRAWAVNCWAWEGGWNCLEEEQGGGERIGLGAGWEGHGRRARPWDHDSGEAHCQT